MWLGLSLGLFLELRLGVSLGLSPELKLGLSLRLSDLDQVAIISNILILYLSIGIHSFLSLYYLRDDRSHIS